MGSDSTPGASSAGISMVTTSPVSTWCEALRADPSTCTRPSSISPLMRERLSSGSCETRNTSSRWAESSEVTMNFMSVEDSMLGTARCGASPVDGRNRSGGSMAAQPQERAGDNQRGAYQLHQRQAIVEQKSAAGIAAEEFDRAALDSIEDEIRADDASGDAPLRAQPDQNAEIQEFGGGLVELCGMKRDVQRRAADPCRDRVGKGYSPRKGCRFAVAAARCEAAETADGVSQRNRRRQQIEDGEKRKLLKMRVQNYPHNAADEPSVEDPGGLESGDAENLARICGVVVPVAEDQPNLRDG